MEKSSVFEMKLDLVAVNKLIEEGYVAVQKHPDAELYLYNYTHKCQFDKVWNEYTMVCRGLITDKEGNILYRPFEKFFNLEEHLGQKKELPNCPFKVHEKLDGSLGILYKINGQWAVATRGSFKSEQAIHATEVLRTKYPNVEFLDGFTYLFEIIYPENRIVVDYKDRDDLVFLCCLRTDSGTPLTIPKGVLPMPRAKAYSEFTDIMKLTEKERDNEEGYVIEWENGLRLKVKFKEYKRLHWLLSSVNSKTIWDLLREGSDIEKVLDHVPDEFYDWVKKTAKNLEFDFYHIKVRCYSDYQEYLTNLRDCKIKPDRKSAALFFKEYCRFPSIMFNLLDSHNPDDQIWKMIKPTASKPFKNNLDL